MKGLVMPWDSSVVRFCVGNGKVTFSTPSTNSIVQLRLLESPHWQTDYKVVYKNHPKPPEDFKTPLDESSSGESFSEESSSGDDSI
jgi:hypothetical protein